jgi:hypothetical protein
MHITLSRMSGRAPLFGCGSKMHRAGTKSPRCHPARALLFAAQASGLMDEAALPWRARASSSASTQPGHRRLFYRLLMIWSSLSVARTPLRSSGILPSQLLKKPTSKFKRLRKRVVSPLLANLFLHYAFDTWMARSFPRIPFERYADDAICHCKSAEEAQALWGALADRFAACRLVLHPEKTRIVYCKDASDLTVFARNREIGRARPPPANVECGREQNPRAVALSTLAPLPHKALLALGTRQPDQRDRLAHRRTSGVNEEWVAPIGARPG